MEVSLAGHNTYKKLIKYTMPMIFMMVVINIYSIIDGLFVSNLVGTNEFAAVNLVWPIVMVLGSVGFMIGSGGSALIARTLGMGDNKNATNYFSMLMIFQIVMGIILAIVGEVILRPVERLMGADSDTIVSCMKYGRIMMGFIPFLMLQYSFQSFLGVAGKGRLALILTIAAGVTNMICDFVLIYFFDLELYGAALATALSWLVGGLIPLLYFIFKRNGSFHFKPVFLKIKPIAISCYNGLSEMLTQISMSVANIIFDFWLIRLYGNNDGIFALGIIMYVSFVFTGMYVGYSMGAGQKIAFNYGAKNIDEVNNLLRKSLVVILISSVVLALSSVLFAHPFAYIFAHSDKKLLDLSTKVLMIYSLVYLINGYNIFASSFFTALGNGSASGAISFLRSFVFQIPLIFILPLAFGKTFVWFAVFTSEILTCIISFIITKKLRKKYNYNFF